MTTFPWRVVTLDHAGDVTACFGYMHDEAAARRVQKTFADRGDLVVQYQPPPDVHPWTIVESTKARVTRLVEENRDVLDRLASGPEDGRR